MFAGLKSYLGLSQNSSGYTPLLDDDPLPRTCFGREISFENLLRTTMVVFVVAGAILTLLGISVFASNMPQTAKYALFQNIHKFSVQFAMKIGSDLQTLSLFSMTVGGAFLVGGVGCLIQQRMELLDVPITGS